MQLEMTDALGSSAMVCALGPPICHGTPRAWARLTKTLPLKGKDTARGVQSAALDAKIQILDKYKTELKHECIGER